MISTVCWVVERHQGAAAHALLKEKGWLHPDIEVLHLGEASIGFPLNLEDDAIPGTIVDTLSGDGRLEEHMVMVKTPVDPHRRLAAQVAAWMDQHAQEATTWGLTEHLPTRWERLGDLVLLPHETMAQTGWMEARRHPHATMLWERMAEALKVSSLGVQGPIADDTFRSSQVEMLLGTSEVVLRDHGITYTFDAAKVMFSSGNITERRRIGGLRLDGETVVDAYAGVGYYALPMLVHGNVAHLHACEINPASIEGLRKAAAINGVEERLTIHEGDNSDALMTLEGLADRCHLGLLPSSEPVWESCFLALKPSGGTLHIHMNVEEEHIETWVANTLERFRGIAKKHGRKVDIIADHLEKVKWFAPFVRHVVLDLRIHQVR